MNFKFIAKNASRSQLNMLMGLLQPLLWLLIDKPYCTIVVWN